MVNNDERLLFRTWANRTCFRPVERLPISPGTAEEPEPREDASLFMPFSVFVAGTVGLPYLFVLSQIQASQESPAEWALFFAICGVGLVLYLIPSLVAILRKHPNLAPIMIVNILLGWTLVGYVVALAWSFTAIKRDLR